MSVAVNLNGIIVATASAVYTYGLNLNNVFAAALNVNAMTQMTFTVPSGLNQLLIIKGVACYFY